MFVIDRDQLEIVSFLIRSLTAHSFRSLESQRTQRLLICCQLFKVSKIHRLPWDKIPAHSDLK